jgi:DNA polymerase-3 subunit epsilon/ATP-dependent DNA helicase DinG
MTRTYVALDTETTGFNPERDAIIEIGAVRFRDDGRILDEWSTLVNPGRSIPFGVVQLTGITSQMVASAPRLEAVEGQLRRFVGNDTAAVIGHNVQFDLGFLRQQGVYLQSPALDTFELATILLPTEARYSLGSLTDRFDVASEQQHRALDDARACQALFLVLLEQAMERVPLPTIQEIARLSRGSEWLLRAFFEEVERRRTSHPFSERRKSAPALAGSGGGPLLEEDEAEPLQPIPNPTPVQADRLARMLEPGGVFAQYFPHFEFRPPQVHMLRAVAEAFNQSGQLLVEAGTGVGKSLAYLIPAVFFAVSNSARVVISTNTINLQDQLFRKDIPDLRQVLSANGGEHGGQLPDLRVAVLKGRTNYICMRRLAAMRSRGDLTPDELRVLARILVWLQQTLSGDRSELFLPTARDRSVWLSVAANNESCQPDLCWHAHRDQCFFYQARRRAERAHVIVVNHALLLSDVAVANRVLPEYKHLIVDEAHQLEAATTHQLSFASDERRMIRLLESISHSSRSRASGLLADLLATAQKALPAGTRTQLSAHVTPLQALTARCESRVVSFFDALHEFVEDQELMRSGSTYSQRIRVTSGLRIQPAWSRVEIAWDDAAETLRRLADGLQRLARGMDELSQYDLPNHMEMVQSLSDAVVGLREQIAQTGALVSQPEAASIYWIDIRPPEQGRHLSLHVAPLHIGPLVEKHILLAKDTVVLTSATLRTAGDFEFIQERLHAWEADTLAVGSPFDYASSTLLYLPSDIPEPNAPGYQRAVERAMAALIAATRGRTLALFTSYNQLRRTAEAIGPRLADEGITLLEQGGGGSRAQLLESFRTLDKAALLGTRSFWEGIDVLGPALSCLVIARLPFSVPTDPVYAARSESFDEPFYQYSVPETILRFRQAFGRLIRSKTDRGVVVVLDRRLQTKAYGKFFLDSLPECTERRGPLASLPQAAARWIDLDV